MNRSGDIVRIGGGAVNVAENERVEGDVVCDRWSGDDRRRGDG